jgi:hypothetical protein
VDEPGFLPRLISGIFAEAQQRTDTQHTQLDIDVSYVRATPRAFFCVLHCPQ